MEKLTYTTEEQIINDAAQMLIKSHLKWSNSLNFLPSFRLSNVYSMMMDAILESKYTPEEWRALTESEQAQQEREVREIAEKAAKLADSKWEAAMVLLGIED